MKEKTKDIGFSKVYQKIKSLGAKDICEIKTGNRRAIFFTSDNGRVYRVTTRAKMRGTWQTSITYGEKCCENKNEDEYWVFVDISSDDSDFYVVPMWWMKNDIANHHEKYLNEHGGRRRDNVFSKHHAIAKYRIVQWENKWQQIGL